MYIYNNILYISTKAFVTIYTARHLYPSPPSEPEDEYYLWLFLRFRNPHKSRRLIWSRIFTVRITSCAVIFIIIYLYVCTWLFFFISGITRCIRRFPNLWTNRRPRWLVIDVPSVCWPNCTGEFLSQSCIKIANQHTDANFRLTHVFCV